MHHCVRVAPAVNSPRSALTLVALGGLLGLTLGVGSGCAEGRTDNNPFVGTSGAAIEQPYGDGSELVVNHDSGMRP
jgi:hypothetical protein